MKIESITLQQSHTSRSGSIGGIRLPDFNDKYVYTGKKSGISDADYHSLIEKQAYQDFEKDLFQNKSEGFIYLMKQYISEVSPDRKGIITEGLKRIASDMSLF